MVKKSIDYPDVLENSMSILKKNVILFVPNLVLVLTSFMLFIIFFHLSGLAEMFIMKPFLLEDTFALRGAMASITTTPQFILSLTFFLIFALLLSAFFLVMKFGMIRDVMKKGKTSLISGAEFAEKNYLNFIVVYLSVKIIIYLPLIVLLFIYFLTVSSNTYVLLGQFLLGLFGVVWFFYALVMIIRLLFVYPVMTFEHDKYFSVIGHEFHYVKTHITHTVVSFLIVLVVLFAYAFIRETVNIFGYDIQAYGVVVVLTILLVLLEVIVTTWEHVFIFKSYTESRKIDKIVKDATSKNKKSNQKNKTKAPNKNSNNSKKTAKKKK